MPWMSILAKNRKYPEKRKKNNNPLKKHKILNIKMSAEGSLYFTFSLPGWAVHPLPPSVTPLSVDVVG